MKKIIKNNDEDNSWNKLQLTKHLTLTWSQSSKEIMYYNEEEEEEIVLDQHTSNVLLVEKLNKKYFLSVTDDNIIKIWTTKGKPYSSLDCHSAEIIGLEIYEDRILSVSKNDSICMSNFKGEELYVIEEKIESLEQIKIWNDSIHVLQDSNLNIYSIYDGQIIISLKGQSTFINKFQRLNNNYILTKFDDVVKLWKPDGELSNKLDISFNFSKLIELTNGDIAILTDDNIVVIMDYNGEVVSKYNDNDEFVKEFKVFIESYYNLITSKNEKNDIKQFPHIYNPTGKVLKSTTEEIINQGINFSDKKVRLMWDFFNRPLFSPIKKLLKKEENLTKKFQKAILSLTIVKEDAVKTSEELLAKTTKSRVVMLILMLITLLAGGAVGYLVDQQGYGILVLSFILLFVIISKGKQIKDIQSNIEKFKQQLATLDTIFDETVVLIKNIKAYRSSLFRQFPIIQDNTLYSGLKVDEIMNALLNNDIHKVAMDECGIVSDDILHETQKAIILNDWSLIQANTDKVNRHNINSFWGVENKIIFATQFIQYVFLTKDKIDVFNTHYDFIQNKFVKKESHAFYYKDVTNITKKEVDRELMTSDEISSATEITLKVSSGDSIQITIFNEDTFTKLKNEIVNANSQNDSDDMKLAELEKERKAIQEDDSLDEEEKNDELKFIDSQIAELKSYVSISDSQYEEINKVDSTIQNIRAQIRIHKQ